MLQRSTPISSTETAKRVGRDTSESHFGLDEYAVSANGSVFPSTWTSTGYTGLPWAIAFFSGVAKTIGSATTTAKMRHVLPSPRAARTTRIALAVSTIGTSWNFVLTAIAASAAAKTTSRSRIVRGCASARWAQRRSIVAQTFAG